MKNIVKRFLAIVMAMAMCVCFASTAFADEPESEKCVSAYTVEATSEGISSIVDENGNEVLPSVMRSYIFGYAQGTVTSSKSHIPVYPETVSSGGMGITVKASSSWNGDMYLTVIGQDASVPLDNARVSSNGETYFNNLWHTTTSAYGFAFTGIPEGQSVYVQIWVYG